MRVLHLPSSLGSNAYNLSIGEKKNGVESTVLINNPNMYSNKADIIFRPTTNKYYNVLRAIFFSFFNATKYDVVHYNYGTVLCNTNKKCLFGLDLLIFRRKAKVIAVTFQGSDARQAQYCLGHYTITHYSKLDAAQQKADDKRKEERITFFDKYSDLIYATNPDLLNILPLRAKFRPYTKLQPSEWIPCYSDYSKKRTVILHAPTKQKVKGTEYIDRAICRLQDEGYDIEYLLLQGIPNSKVIEYYKKADLVIDQLLVGWYGGLAVECMALGKPVMCYIRESDMKYIPPEMNQEMPIIRVTKDCLYNQLKGILDSKADLDVIAHQSRMYIEKWHNPETIAKEIICDYGRVIDRKKSGNSGKTI